MGYSMLTSVTVYHNTSKPVLIVFGFFCVLHDKKGLRVWFVLQTVQQRGAAVIQARKLSSAMSAAKATCDHLRDWWHGTKEVSIDSTTATEEFVLVLMYSFCLQCFDAVGWAAGRASGL